MPSMNYTLTRGEDDFELELDYSVSPYVAARTYGPPEDCSPAEGGEIEELDITHNGDPFTVTDKEMQAIERHIYGHHDYEVDDDDGYEAWESERDFL